jgi:hypothetical protein
MSLFLALTNSLKRHASHLPATRQTLPCLQSQAQDPSVNRPEDSIILWKAICSSKLLINTIMILLLNNCDLLERKLESGVKVREYITDFGDRPNDVQTVIKCL